MNVKFYHIKKVSKYKNVSAYKNLTEYKNVSEDTLFYKNP